MAVVLALIGFLLLATLAAAAGLFGLWLALVIIPAYFRYLLYLLEARANGRDAPTPGIELFNWVQNFWSLFPLVLVCILIWAEVVLALKFGMVVATIAGLLMLVVFPASMAVLALTRSPLESLNPAALLRVVKACGLDYALIPLTVMAVSVIVRYLYVLRLPDLVVDAAMIYVSFLMFTFTGRVLHRHAVAIPVEMPAQREPEAETVDALLTRDRVKALNHAYGFISRGNRDGGLNHLYRWIDTESDPDAAYRWFFDEMLKWESHDAALFLAQKYLSWLLSQKRDTDALKLMARCLLENARFKPLPEDLGAALEAAERLGNEELIKHLEGFRR